MPSPAQVPSLRQAEACPILIVDDDEDVLAVLTRQLEPLGHTLVPTPSPAEALHLLRTRDFGILISDLCMPQVDGNEVLKTAREVNPNIVSIAISGRADRDAVIRAVNDGGIWKFLMKPWRRDELLQTVKDAAIRFARMRRPQARLGRIAHDITERRVSSQAGKRSIRLTRGTAKAPQPDRQRLRNVHIHGRTGGFESGRYRLLELLGRGRAGEVYRAEDTMLNMFVAVKVLAPEFLQREEEIRILKEEARIAMQLSHNHIVRLHNLRRSADGYFLVMEYVDGCTFHEVLKEHGLLSIETVAQIVNVAAGALAYAHRHHVLHKDLKPSNLMLTKDGVVKIIDFGVACLKDRQPAPGVVMGTPGYMSPEQIAGQPLDERTDVYSLACVVYELLTGFPPFPPGGEPAQILAMMPADVTPVPACVRHVLEQALNPDLAARCASMAAFERAFVDASAPEQ